MPCVDDQAWYLWHFGQRLSCPTAGRWTLAEQMEAYEEIDVIAATTLSGSIRRRCLQVLTSRPDIALMVRLGVSFGGEAGALLSAEMTAPARLAAVDTQPAVVNASLGSAHRQMQWKLPDRSDAKCWAQFESLIASFCKPPRPEVWIVEPKVAQNGRGRSVLFAVLDTGVDQTHVTLA